MSKSQVTRPRGKMTAGGIREIDQTVGTMTGTVGKMIKVLGR